MKGIVEALLFAHGEPLSWKKISKITGLTKVNTLDILQELSAEYEREDRGIFLIQTDDCFQLATKKQYHEYVSQLFKQSKRKGLSAAALEVLAIIAVRQPVTRAEIESIRGVNSDGTIQHLMARELIAVAGNVDGFSRAQLLATTQTFLRVFGMKSLDDMPTVEALDIFLEASEGGE